MIEQRATDHATGEPAFTSTVRMFITGEGGFGGEREAGPGREPLPDSPPDHSTEARTLAIQTLLYRHGGHDANPLHFDPEFARRAGWDAPILTGQNVLGFACRALVHTVLDGDPARLRSIEGRFSAPAYNGDTLRTEIWTDRPTPRAFASATRRARCSWIAVRPASSDMSISAPRSHRDAAARPGIHPRGVHPGALTRSRRDPTFLHQALARVARRGGRAANTSRSRATRGSRCAAIWSG